MVHERLQWTDLLQVVQDGRERQPGMLIALDLDQRRQRQVALFSPVCHYSESPGPEHGLGTRI